MSARFYCRDVCGHPGSFYVSIQALPPPPHNRIILKGGLPMAQPRKEVTFVFVNPNTPKDLERQFHKILTEKLLSSIQTHHS
jgi:hypothetical protein